MLPEQGLSRGTCAPARLQYTSEGGASITPEIKPLTRAGRLLWPDGKRP
jgi:hypothetical protein